MWFYVAVPWLPVYKDDKVKALLRLQQMCGEVRPPLPRINNCVGINNHNYFYQFVVTMFLVIATTLAHSFWILAEVINNGYHNVHYWTYPWV